MKLPSSRIQFPRGYHWDPQELDVDVLQSHVLKHPLGINALRRSRAWNDEGWDAITPAVVTVDQRDRVVAKIVALGDAKLRCEVRELRGKQSKNPEPECRACSAPLIHQCAKALDAEEIRARYLGVAEGCVRELVGGEVVPFADLSKRLLGGLNRPEVWEGLTVMSVGLEKGSPVMRVSRVDGTRVDLYIHGKALRWRTTFRSPANVVGTGSRWSFLLDRPTPDPTLSLSDACVVPRDWSNRHGT